MGRLAAFTLTALLFLGTYLPTAAIAPLRIDIDPWGFVSSPHPTARVHVHIERHAANVGASVSLYADGFLSNTSQFEIHGEHAPVAYDFKYPNLDAGVYRAQLDLYRDNGRGGLTTLTVQSQLLTILP